MGNKKFSAEQVKEAVDELSFLADTLINFDKDSLDYSLVKEEFLKKAVLFRDNLKEISDKLRRNLDD